MGRTLGAAYEHATSGLNAELRGDQHPATPPRLFRTTTLNHLRLSASQVLAEEGLDTAVEFDGVFNVGRAVALSA